MTTGTIVFIVLYALYAAVMVPLLRLVIRNERADWKKTRKVARKRAWFEGKGDWPGYGL